jgi:pyruvate,orthophosphate dikinase
MHYANGILTARGGMTSHAAVVARGMGTCCVSGVGDITFSADGKSFTVGGKTYKEGDWISLDGSTGNVYGQSIKTVPAEIGGYFGRVMGWADAIRTMKVRTNADTPADAKQAMDFGAEGIGLCRTEHMFFEADRIAAIREMIVSKTVEQRKAALAKLLPMQRGDFEAIYEAMQGYPVTIRLLDPPLHEFLPTDEDDIQALAAEMKMEVDELNSVIASLHEFNPMMGHRGCRLDVTYPEIGEMQTQAIIEAAINVQKRHPEWTVVPEIMVPLVGEAKELAFVKAIITETADRIIAESGVDLTYQVGTMIEIPRAAVTADEIARGRRVLQLRHQRPDPDDLRLQPRRRRQVPGGLLRQEDLRERPLRPFGSERRGQTRGDGRQAWPPDPTRHQAGHLRRARRRAVEREILSSHRAKLCELQPLPCAAGSSGRRSGGAGGEGCAEGRLTHLSRPRPAHG